MEELLRMEGISKRFGTFYANHGVNLDIRRGEVHTLLGENGAGKSTLMNILIGLYQPTEGRIFMGGKEVHITSPAVAVEHGIGMVHQHFMLIEAMTGFENIILGSKVNPSPLIEEAKDKKAIMELAERYGLEVDLDLPVSEMSIGMQQRVEILKVLYRGAELLILDEPTAVLTDQEVEGLFEIMQSLTAEGKSVIFISHKMREVTRISDRVTVLRAGESVETLEMADTTGQELSDLMIGHHYVESTYEKVAGERPVLEIKGVSYHPEEKHGGLRDVDLTVHSGEIVGIAGIDGNGQSQVAALVAGLIAPESGEVWRNGEKVAVFSPEDFIDQGLGNIPEDRNKMGLVGDMTVAQNLILKETDSDRFSLGHGLWLKSGAIQEFAETKRAENDIRCTSVNQTARSLSGGNQQKVIISRWLANDPDVLILDEPTRGIDVGAKYEIYTIMAELAAQGKSIIMISSEMAELIGMSDRIVVMCNGRVTGEVAKEDATQENIMSLATKFN